MSSASMGKRMGKDIVVDGQVIKRKDLIFGGFGTLGSQMIQNRNQQIAVDRQKAQKEAQKRKLNQQALDFLRARFRTSAQASSNALNADVQAPGSSGSLFAQITGGA